MTNPRRMATQSPPKAAAAQATPDRRAMEAYLAAVASSGADNALLDALNVIYDAWEPTTARSWTALPCQALAISLLCAGA